MQARELEVERLALQWLGGALELRLQQRHAARRIPALLVDLLQSLGDLLGADALAGQLLQRVDLLLAPLPAGEQREVQLRSLVLAAQLLGIEDGPLAQARGPAGASRVELAQPLDQPDSLARVPALQGELA